MQIRCRSTGYRSCSSWRGFRGHAPRDFYMETGELIFRERPRSRRAQPLIKHSNYFNAGDTLICREIHCTRLKLQFPSWLDRSAQPLSILIYAGWKVRFIDAINYKRIKPVSRNHRTEIGAKMARVPVNINFA